MSCMLLLAGCGSTGNSEGGSKAGFNQKENADQEKVSQENTSQAQEVILNGGFGNVGNNPNNLWQSGNNGWALAFDETYIYYSLYDENVGLYRVKYDGSENTEIADGNFTSLNVYDGYIYGVSQAGDSGPAIWRIRTDNFEMEQLTVDKPVYTLLVFDDMVFYCTHDTDTNKQDIHALDLISMNDVVLEENYTQNRIAFTTDGSYAYAYIVQNSDNGAIGIYRVLPSEVRESSEPQYKFSKVAGGMNLGYFSAVSFTPDGIRSISSSKDALKVFLYENIDIENLNWKSEDSLRIECDRDALFNGKASAVMAQTPRYYLGNNIVALVTGATAHTTYIALQDYTKGEIYYFKDCNLSDGQFIGFIEKDTGCYGMRDDVLYLIDGVSENDTSYELVTITADGNMTRTAVQ